MGCHIVSDLHINTILATARHHGLTVVSRDGRRTFQLAIGTDCADLGDILMGANVKSFNHRYGDDVVSPFQYAEQTGPVGVAQAMHLLTSLDYQSCEVPKWEVTEAYFLICQLVFELSRQLDTSNLKWEL